MGASRSPKRKGPMRNGLECNGRSPPSSVHHRVRVSIPRRRFMQLRRLVCTSRPWVHLCGQHIAPRGAHATMNVKRKNTTMPVWYFTL